MTIILAATRNAHKVEELRSLLGSEFQIRSLAAFAGAPNVVEDAPTFAGNARKKAETLAGWIAQQHVGGAGIDFVLADDSGLEVDALGGAPGVHSARFAAEDTSLGNSPDADNNAKLLRLLQDVPMANRTGRFRCVLALARVGEFALAGELAPVPAVILFEGICEGRIGNEPQGKGGFGYDPLFIPQGCSETFAQLGEATKNQLSHRARAMQKLKEVDNMRTGS